MGISLNINEKAIQKKIEEAQQKMINRVVRVLRYCGEMAVNEAKMNGSYQDQTGNLRSSIGYVIAIEGKVLEDNFPNSKNAEGLKVGKDLAHEIAKQTPEIALIVVAGMKYASYVESRGRNVLTSAEQMAKVIVPQMLKQLK